jgi:hypothetical protein
MRGAPAIKGPLKKCIKCGKRKPVTDFLLKDPENGWREKKCRDCKRASIESWRKKSGERDYILRRERKLAKEISKEIVRRRADPAVIRDKARQSRLDRYEAYNKYKDKPCEDCGRRFPPCVMDFHHVKGPKLGTVAYMWMSRKYSMHLLEEEMAKCVLICSNCHRIRHHTSDTELEDD